MASIAIEDDKHWHSLRLKHVGSSDIACLLGLSKRKTRWSTWLEKSGQLPPIDLDNISHIRNGKQFEPAIAAIGAETFGVKIRKVRRYITADDCPDLGVTEDYEEVAPGYPPVEIKWSVIGIGWEYDGLNVLTAPDEYLIQIQAQLACSPGAPYARLWGFINGEVRQMIVEPRPVIIDAIKATAKEFMDSVRLKQEPPVDFNLDGDALGRLSLIRNIEAIDWSKDEDAGTLAQMYFLAAADKKSADAAEEWAKNKLLKRILDHCKDTEKDNKKVVVLLPKAKISFATVAADPGTIVSPEMVGTVIGVRQGYRRMTIKPKKESKDVETEAETA
jgi:hypothetical protein